MARYVGTRHHVLTAAEHSTLPWWKASAGDWYILDGLRCQGEPLAPTGCDRQCALVWHRSWLRLDTPAAIATSTIAPPSTQL